MSPLPVSLSVLLVIMPAVLTAPPYETVNCNVTATRRGDTICYEFAEAARRTWEDANEICQSRGGKLPVIASASENEAVRQLLEVTQLYDVWIGAKEYHYTWSWLGGAEVASQGCYADGVDMPDLPYRRLLGNNTGEACREHCTSVSGKYAVLRGGSECGCDDNLDRYGAPVSGGCLTPCSGDPTKHCGGTGASNILAVGGTFSTWDEDQPNNHIGYQTCVELDQEQGYLWNDVTWNEGNGAICELSSCANITDQNHTVGDTAEGSCFLILDDHLRWFDARWRCVQLGGELATFGTEGDQDLVVDYLRNSTIDLRGFWIGITKWLWKWSTGEDVLYTSWDFDQPKGPDQSCATLLSSDGYWKDTTCNSQHPVICQFDTSIVDSRPSTPPPPSTTAPPTTPPSTTPRPPRPTTPGLEQIIKAFFTRTEVLAGFIATGAFLIFVLVIVIAVKCYKKRRADRDTAARIQKEEAPYVAADHFFALDAEGQGQNETDQRDSDYTNLNHVDRDQTGKHGPDYTDLDHAGLDQSDPDENHVTSDTRISAASVPDQNHTAAVHADPDHSDDASEISGKLNHRNSDTDVTDNAIGSDPDSPGAARTSARTVSFPPDVVPRD